MTKCPNCGKENRQAARFCQFCGALLETVVISDVSDTDEISLDRDVHPFPEPSTSGETVSDVPAVDDVTAPDVDETADAETGLDAGMEPRQVDSVGDHAQARFIGPDLPAAVVGDGLSIAHENIHEALGPGVEPCLEAFPVNVQSADCHHMVPDTGEALYDAQAYTDARPIGHNDIEVVRPEET